jgi:hypothetical protein
LGRTNLRQVSASVIMRQHLVQHAVPTPHPPDNGPIASLMTPRVILSLVSQTFGPRNERSEVGFAVQSRRQPSYPLDTVTGLGHAPPHPGPNGPARFARALPEHLAEPRAPSRCFVQAAQKGPDARRHAAGRVRRTGGTPQRVARRANAADGPFSAAC